jgi:DNA-binding IclR family transcriptional regulator
MSTIGRALQILDDLGRRTTLTSLSAIARRTGLPKSTVHRLLGILEEDGAVERDRGLYRLGARSIGRAHAGDGRHERLRRTVMPYLVDLYEHVDRSVSSAVLDNVTLVYLDTLHSPGPGPLAVPDDDATPACTTAAGLLLLAYARLTGPALSELTGPAGTTPARLTAEFVRIRREGVAYSMEENVRGLVDVASPVTVATGRPVAAMTVHGLAHGSDFAAVVAILRGRAYAASREVRHQARDVEDPEPDDGAPIA